MTKLLVTLLALTLTACAPHPLEQPPQVREAFIHQYSRSNQLHIKTGTVIFQQRAVTGVNLNDTTFYIKVEHEELDDES